MLYVYQDNVLCVDMILFVCECNVDCAGICEECGETPPSLQWMYPDGPPGGYDSRRTGGSRSSWGPGRRRPFWLRSLRSSSSDRPVSIPHASQSAARRSVMSSFLSFSNNILHLQKVEHGQHPHLGGVPGQDRQGLLQPHLQRPGGNREGRDLLCDLPL